VSGVTTIRTASGLERHWLYRNFCYQAQGNQRYVICSAHDITDEEEARRRLQQLNESLTTQVRSGKEALVSTHTDLSRTKAELDAFLYRSSHDLMGPLCSLKGLLHLAQAESPQGNLEPYFGLLHQSLHKLEHVLNHLRMHSDNKQHELHYEPVNFDAMLARAVGGCSQVKGFNRISLQSEIVGDTPVVTDRERLLVVLKSLLANSIAFQNFSIPDPRVRVMITTTPARVQICVADNGIGIPADKLDSIFKLFDRSSTQSQGAGLGLYIAKEVVETLAGTIRVQSHPGVGSTFVVELPNCLPASGDHEAITHAPSDRAGTMQ
jgi:signal transduction histidine kinase